MTQVIELTGIIRDGKTIELDRSTALPDGCRIRLRLAIGADDALDRSDEVVAEIDPATEETLRTIYDMRHSGRSLQEP